MSLKMDDMEVMPRAVATPTTFTLAALASEITNNPNSLTDTVTGLTLTQLASEQYNADQTAANLLNTVQSGSNYVVYNQSVTVASLIQAIGATDFAALTQLQISQLQLLFLEGTLDATNSNTRSIVTNIFSSASSATKTAIVAIATRQGSRAEVLWGSGFVVSAVWVGQAV